MSSPDSFEVRLWDTQWMNVVNADYSGMSREDAIAEAVKATEQAMARNFADNQWPRARVKGGAA
ncbi:hypothetical protein ACNPMX_11705 [Stenotrophomonas maltophilia]